MLDKSKYVKFIIIMVLFFLCNEIVSATASKSSDCPTGGLKTMAIDEFEKLHVFGTIPELKSHIDDSTGFVDDIIVIGIAGGSGSGKTTLAEAICKELGAENVTYIQHDSYYRDNNHLSFHERATQNFDHPDSLETSLLIDHVNKLRQGLKVLKPEYDFATHSRKQETVEIEPRPVIVVEGILILSEQELNKLFDIRVFVDTDDDIRLIRRIQRDTVERGRSLDGIVEQYLRTVRPMHIEFVEPSKKHAHIIVPTGLNSVALELVVSRLKASIRKYYRNRGSNSKSTSPNPAITSSQ